MQMEMGMRMEMEMEMEMEMVKMVWMTELTLKSIIVHHQVVVALSTGMICHIPFRDSKLTRLLQNCLGKRLV